MGKQTLYILCGLPGSGKTTLAKQIETEHSAIRFCPDEWMEELGITLWNSEVRSALEDRFWVLSKKLLAQGASVVLEYGFWSKSERDRYHETALQLGARVELHYLNVPKDVLKQRLQSRGMEGDAVIIRKLDEYFDVFEQPTETELSQYESHMENPPL